MQALPFWTLVCYPATEKGLHQTVPTKLSKMSWNAEAFTGTKGPHNNPIKQCRYIIGFNN